MSIRKILNTLLLFALSATTPCYAAEIRLISADPVGLGLNDLTEVAALPDNPATTLGAQRRLVVEAAANRWAEHLRSDVPIQVSVRFESMPCEGGEAVLGTTNNTQLFQGFSSQAAPNTWYSSALANSLAGYDLDPNQADIHLRLNAQLAPGNTECLGGASWYLGLNADTPSNTVNLYRIVQHELAHGLGFTSFIDAASGERILGRDDSFSAKLFDLSEGKAWSQLLPSARRQSAINEGNLVWGGENANALTEHYSSGIKDGHIQMYAPSRFVSGRSVNHFSDALFPNELMEPFASAAADLRLTKLALQDIGWKVHDAYPENDDPRTFEANLEKMMVNAGVAYFYSSQNRSIFRWAIEENRFLSPIRLMRTPTSVHLSPANQKIYTQYRDKTILQIDLTRDEPYEQTYVSISASNCEMNDADEYLIVCASEVFDAEGKVIIEDSAQPLPEGGRWNSATQHLFYLEKRRESKNLVALALDDDRFTARFSELESNVGMVPPIRVNEPGNRIVLGSGRVFNADLVELPSLSGSFDDGIWVNGNFISAKQQGVRFKLSQWSPELVEMTALEIPGKILGLALNQGEVLVASILDGLLVIGHYDVNQVDDRDNDGIANADDPAPLDPRQLDKTRDSDGDGIADYIEHYYGLDPNANDASADLDNDGVTNHAEFLNGSALDNTDTDGDGIEDGEDPRPLNAEFSVRVEDSFRRTRIKDDIAYLLFANPNVLQRYDLTNQTFQEDIFLAAPPEDFYVDDDGIYIQYQKKIDKHTLRGVFQETLYYHNEDGVSGVAALGDFVYTTLRSIRQAVVINKRSREVHTTSWIYPMTGLSVVPSASLIRGKIRGWDKTGWAYGFHIDPDSGLISESMDTYDLSKSGTNTFVFPNDRLVVDDYGLTYTPDSTVSFVTGNFGGILEDLTFIDLDPYVVRGTSIIRYSGSGDYATGDYSASLAQETRHILCYKPYSIDSHDSKLVSFYLLENGQTGVDLIDPATFNQGDVDCKTRDPNVTNFNADIVFNDKHGVIYFVDKAHSVIHRWDPEQNSYAESIALSAEPDYVVYSADLHRLYIAYSTGMVNVIDIDQPELEQSFIQELSSPCGLVVTASEVVLCLDEEDSNRRRSLFGYNLEPGDQENRRYVGFGSVLSDLVWNSNQEKLFYFSDPLRDIGEIDWITLGEDGLLGRPNFNRYRSGEGLVGTTGVVEPIVPASLSDLVLLGNGQILSAKTFRLHDELEQTVDKGLWLGRQLVTLKEIDGETELVAWDDNFKQKYKANFTGKPLALINLDDKRIAVVTQREKPVITLLHAEDLAISDADNDGINDLFDNCWESSNADQGDYEQDNVGDICDSDDDDDQVPDHIELRLALDPLDPSDANEDSDGDTFTNVTEVLNGSDAKNADSTPKLFTPGHLLVVPDNHTGMQYADNRVLEYDRRGVLIARHEITDEFEDSNNISPGDAVFLDDGRLVIVYPRSVRTRDSRMRIFDGQWSHVRLWLPLSGEMVTWKNKLIAAGGRGDVQGLYVINTEDFSSVWRPLDIEDFSLMLGSDEKIYLSDNDYVVVLDANTLVELDRVRVTYDFPFEFSVDNLGFIWGFKFGELIKTDLDEVIHARYPRVSGTGGAIVSSNDRRFCTGGLSTKFLLDPDNGFAGSIIGGKCVFVPSLDSDNDGVADSIDAKPLDPDVQSDTDGDGIDDSVDSDRDGDQIANVDDNCPNVANSSQLDMDEDGFGNLCDEDIDGDSTYNWDDTHPYGDETDNRAPNVRHNLRLVGSIAVSADPNEFSVDRSLSLSTIFDAPQLEHDSGTYFRQYYSQLDNTVPLQTLVATAPKDGDFYGGAIHQSGEWTLVGGDELAYLYKRDLGEYKLYHTFYSPLYGTESEASIDYARRVLVAGNQILISADGFDRGNAKGAGAIFVYEEINPGHWQIVQTITTKNAVQNYRFGRVMAVAEETLVVSNGGDQHDSEPGIYLFQRENNRWVEKNRFSFPYTETRYGLTLALSENRLAVGSPEVNRPGEAIKGSVYLYKKTDSGEWQEDHIFTTPKGRGRKMVKYFGSSVDIVGDRLVVGASATDDSRLTHFYEKKSDVGVAFLFEEIAEGQWLQTEIVNPNSEFENDERFGAGVQFFQADSLFIQSSGTERLHQYQYALNTQLDQAEKPYQVADLFGGNFVDDDGDLFAGIAVVNIETDDAKGQWQYRLHDSESWTALPRAIDESNSLILAANAELQFMPSQGFRGLAPVVSVKLWDGRCLAEGFQDIRLFVSGAGCLSETNILLDARVGMLDADADEMDDRWEIRYGLDPNNASDAHSDLDNDELSALEEFKYGTNPEHADTDLDGLVDSVELQQTLSDATVYDTDKDGIPDGWEHLHNFDPLVMDSDKDADQDGFTNKQEFFGNSQPESPDSTPFVDDWLTYQGNAQHAGYTPILLNTDFVRSLWEVPIANMQYPVTSKGKLFLSSIDDPDSYYFTGYLYSLDLMTGEELWSIPFESIQYINPPAVTEDRVYIHSLTGNEHRLTSFNHEGEIKFQQDYRYEHQDQRDVFHDGDSLYFYFSSSDYVKRIDLATGFVHWDQKISAYGTPAIANRYIVSYGESHLLVYDRFSGEEFTRILGPEASFSFFDRDKKKPAPVIGSHNNAIVVVDKQLVNFDISRRQLAWRVGDTYTGQPVLANGVIYVYGDETIDAVDERRGEKIWSHQSGELVSPMLVTASHLFYALSDRVVAFNLNAQKIDRQFYIDNAALAISQEKILLMVGSKKVSAYRLLDDEDNDGISDRYEALHGLNIQDAFDFNSDSDSDGLSAIQEFVMGTAANNPDSDGDNVIDGDDAFPNNPDEWLDSDGDRVGDNADAFPNDAHEWLDSDMDGIGDNQDESPLPDGEISFLLSSANVDENATSLEVKLLRRESLTGEIYVDYSFVDGSATASNDFNSQPGRLTFGHLQEEQTIEVIIHNDEIVEGNEDFTLRIEGSNGSVGNNYTMTITINDDDVPPSSIGFVNSSIDINENDNSVELEVVRQGGLLRESRVNYYTSDISATASQDYFPAIGQLTFLPGEASRWISVDIVDDANTEGLEAFMVHLAEADEAVLSTSNEVRVNILDGDVPPDAGRIEIERAGYVTAENDPSVLMVSVRRIDGDVGEVSVVLETQSGSAFSGSDYHALREKLVFVDGETLKNVAIAIVNDDIFEPQEEFSIQLKEIEGAVYGERNSASIAIIDDDRSLDHGTIQFSGPLYKASEADDFVLLTLLRSSGSDGEVSVELYTSDLSAIAHEDYQPLSSTVTFAEGVTSQTVKVFLVEDTVTEDEQHFEVKLDSVQGGALLGNPSKATVEIIESLPSSSPGQIRFSGKNYEVSEGVETLSLTVIRINGSDGEASVNYGFTSATAVYGSDFVADDGTLSFADGETQKTIDVTIVDDATYEEPSFFTLALLDAKGATLMEEQIATITIFDNDPEIIPDDKPEPIDEEPEPVDDNNKPSDGNEGTQDQAPPLAKPKEVKGGGGALSLSLLGYLMFCLMFCFIYGQVRNQRYIHAIIKSKKAKIGGK